MDRFNFVLKIRNSEIILHTNWLLTNLNCWYFHFLANQSHLLEMDSSSSALGKQSLRKFTLHNWWLLFCIFCIYSVKYCLADATVCSDIDTAVRLVASPTASLVSSCTATTPTQKKFYLNFADESFNLQYGTNKGVYVLPAPSTAAMLVVQYPSTTYAQKVNYTLSEILIRSPAMHALTALTF